MAQEDTCYCILFGVFRQRDEFILIEEYVLVIGEDIFNILPYSPSIVVCKQTRSTVPVPPGVMG
jgi:hypothetical protein